MNNNEQLIPVSEIDAVVLDSINHISGVSACAFWSTLFYMSDSILDLEKLQTELTRLYNEGNNDEALTIIQLYCELLGTDWPDEITIIESISELKGIFLLEFLLDTADILEDFKNEISCSENRRFRNS